MGVPSLFCSTRGLAVIACLRIITRKDSRRRPAPHSPALRRAPQPQCSETVEWRKRGVEGKSRRQTGW